MTALNQNFDHGQSETEKTHRLIDKIPSREMRMSSSQRCLEHIQQGQLFRVRRRGPGWCGHSFVLPWNELPTWQCLGLVDE